jgi:hypothetical protein
MLDFAFAIAYFVCLVLLWIFGMNHLNAVWRITLGLGTVPPLLLLYFRLKMHEVSPMDYVLEIQGRLLTSQPEAYAANSMRNTPIP